MKYMVISDIHGDINNLNKVLAIYNEENCSKLLVLGDLFNYGIDYYREDIINTLNLIKDNIIAARGNCDNNLIGIKFVMPDINKTILNNKNIIIAHGHLYDKNYLLNLDTDIVFVGHSHISNIDIINEKLYINPGSISKSRRGNNSFIIVDNNILTIRNLDNEIEKSINL